MKLSVYCICNNKQLLHKIITFRKDRS